MSTIDTTARSAMKLALDALERMKRYGNTFGYRSHEQNPYEQVCEAITALREALASEAIEQPAPATELREQEPVAKVCHDLDGHIGWNPNLRQLPDEGNALYTSPPAQRTWVDLTDDEIKKEFHPLHATGLQFARAVLAKSKEKNA